MSKKFMRQETHRHLKLGRKRKKARTWRRPKGRDSKMRLQMKSYPSSPTVGYKTKRELAGKINGLIPKLVHNSTDLSRLTKKNIAIIAKKIGAKKRMEMLDYAREHKIQVLNSGVKK